MFNVFLIATGAEEKALKVQAVTFIHTAGPAVLQVYGAFMWVEEYSDN